MISRPLLRLLLLEPRSAVAAGLQRALETADPEVPPALTLRPDLAAAVDSLHRDPCDAVLFSLPADATQALPALLSLREAAPNAPILVLTDPGSAASLETEEALFREGAAEIAPVDSGGAALLAIVRHMIARHRRQALREEALVLYFRARRLDAVRRLASGAAHDFNNVLMTVRGYASLIEESIPPESPACEDVREIVESVARGHLVTRQLGAVGGRRGADRQPVDVTAILRDMHRMLQRLCGDIVTVHPPVGGDFPRIWAAPVEVETAIVGGVLEALDRLPGRGELRLSLTRETLGDIEGLRIAVAGHSSTGGHDPLHGILPQPSPTSRWYPCSPPSAQAAAQRHRTVLVVDDDDLRDLIAQWLREAGYDAQCGSSAEQALATAIALRTPVDLLLCDMILPDLRGPQVQSRLQQEWPHLRTLFMSAYSHAALRERGLLPDGAALIPKPFRRETLLGAVRTSIADL